MKAPADCKAMFQEAYLNYLEEHYSDRKTYVREESARYAGTCETLQFIYGEEYDRIEAQWRQEALNQYWRTKTEEPGTMLDDDLFDHLGPCYDTVMRYGAKLSEREHDGRIAQIWDYDGKQYAMVWDAKTGKNLRYTDYRNILREKEERAKKHEHE